MARGAGWVAGIVAAALGGAAAPCSAQSVLVLPVGTQGDPEAMGAPSANRVAAALGADAVVGAAVSRLLRERYASPPVTGDPLAGTRDRAQAARRAWVEATAAGDEAAASAALDAMDAAAREMESQPEALDASAASQAALRQALLFIAERSHAANGSTTRAADAMRRFAQFDPGYVFQAREASPPVQEDYARAVAALPRGGLAVEVTERGCTVFRDGRSVGTAPVELQDLTPGEHRIAAVCGPLRTLVHRVQIAPQTRATLLLDPQLDAALALEPSPSLRYPSAAQGRARLASDLAVLGRALGMRRVFAVLASEDRVVALDVGTGAVVGEAAVTDGTRLRALVHHGGALAPSRATAPIAVVPSTTAHAVPIDHGVPARGPGAGPWMVMGLGAAALGAAGVFFALRQDAIGRCDASGEVGVCPTAADAQRAYDAAGWNTATNVSLGVGAAALAGGLAWWIAGSVGGGSAPPRAAFGVVPRADGVVFTIEGTP
jgi:hypothetical protein